MAKRKLTRRQQWRAEKIQAERQARSRKKTSRLEEELRGSELGPEQPGRVIVRYGAQVDVEDEQQQRHRCLLRRNLPPLVCGDRVVWQPGPNDTGVVVAMEPRRSLLERPDADNRLKPVAANIDQILVVAAPEPALDVDLINRYLVAAELTGIPPLLIINKIDLLNDKALARLKERFRIYKDIGYPVIFATTKGEGGLDDLLAHLRDKTSIFVGQSGVGKSSLIQVLLPDEALRTNTLSARSGEGRHTTTATRLYHFPGGGELIDSPGVRAFRLGHVSREQITWGFREFRPYLGQCKFSDCRHDVEPQCAIQTALEKGEISQDRFDSYQRILATSMA
ncbi:MAG TPA: small ribosomal subunit biogenesis GTPase RsgA [Gammaproteobacteria bacterium]|nr:small ribosomal subunit biogenesis GTPase RsgA [Gammaproteobacteria bacterium]